MKGPASVTHCGQRQKELTWVCAHSCGFQLVLTVHHFVSIFCPQPQLPVQKIPTPASETDNSLGQAPYPPPQTQKTTSIRDPHTCLTESPASQIKFLLIQRHLPPKDWRLKCHQPSVWFTGRSDVLTFQWVWLFTSEETVLTNIETVVLTKVPPILPPNPPF